MDFFFLKYENQWSTYYSDVAPHFILEFRLETTELQKKKEEKKKKWETLAENTSVRNHNNKQFTFEPYPHPPLW